MAGAVLPNWRERAEKKLSASIPFTQYIFPVELGDIFLYGSHLLAKDLQDRILVLRDYVRPKTDQPRDERRESCELEQTMKRP